MVDSFLEKISPRDKFLSPTTANHPLKTIQNVKNRTEKLQKLNHDHMAYLIRRLTTNQEIEGSSPSVVDSFLEKISPRDKFLNPTLPTQAFKTFQRVRNCTEKLKPPLIKKVWHNG